MEKALFVKIKSISMKLLKKSIDYIAIICLDTRETGYVNAITAAGVTYAVTKVCTSGNLMECSCDRQHSRRNGGQPQMVNAVTAVGAFVRKQADFEKKRNESCRRRRKQRGGISDKGGRKTPHRRRLLKNVQMPEGEWEWGGCSDNINFGLKHSRTFLDSRYRRKSDLRTLVKLHNNMAGRLVSELGKQSCSLILLFIFFYSVLVELQAIRDSMRLECKCHGLSGSCTVKTCWLKMPPFREVASRLIDRFDHAHKVVLRNDGNSFMTEGGLKFLTKSGQRRHLLPARHDLVYSDESPEFCAPNARTGSLGTTHRECLANSTGVEGCDQLCCSRGHRHRILTEWVNCRCAFKWCCEVTCDKCLERREVNTCL